jgi:hypothetical protein
MSQPSLALQNELCLCGRAAFKIHCPQCGCATVYGLASRADVVTRPNGTTVTLRVYRCRKCTHLFNDDEWQLHCQAPPVNAAKMRQYTTHPDNKLGDLTQESPDHLMEILQKIKLKREREDK